MGIDLNHEWTGSDDFHPGPAGYHAWADAIFPTLEAALGARGDRQAD